MNARIARHKAKMVGKLVERNAPLSRLKRAQRAYEAVKKHMPRPPQERKKKRRSKVLNKEQSEGVRGPVVKKQAWGRHIHRYEKIIRGVNYEWTYHATKGWRRFRLS